MLRHETIPIDLRPVHWPRVSLPSPRTQPIARSQKSNRTGSLHSRRHEGSQGAWLGGCGGEERQSTLDGRLRLGQPRAKNTRHQRYPVSGRLGFQTRARLRRDATGGAREIVTGGERQRDPSLLRPKSQAPEDTYHLVAPPDPHLRHTRQLEPAGGHLGKERRFPQVAGRIPRRLSPTRRRILQRQEKLLPMGSRGKEPVQQRRRGLGRLLVRGQRQDLV